MAEAAEGNLGSRVCKLQEQEVGEPRAGCQGWYGSPDDCSGFQKWQKQSGLKLIWILRNIQEFVPWNPSSRTLRRWRLPGLSVICHRGACSSSQRPGRQRQRRRRDRGWCLSLLPATRPGTVRGRAADLRAKRGSSSWPHHTRVEASLVYIQSAISSPFEALREQSRVMLVLKISVAEMGLLATRSKRLLRRGQERLRQKAIDTPNISARPPR